MILKRTDREQQELYKADFLLTSSIVVGVAQEKILFCFSLMNLRILYCLFWIGDRSQIYLDFIPQSVIKQDMKMELRMEGAVNGHKFVIVGKGEGKPFE